MGLGVKKVLSQNGLKIRPKPKIRVESKSNSIGMLEWCVSMRFDEPSPVLKSFKPQARESSIPNRISIYATVIPTIILDQVFGIHIQKYVSSLILDQVYMTQSGIRLLHILALWDT